SLSSNRVNIVYQDHDKNLWIGTANGVNLYNPKLENFTPIDILDIKGGRNFISSIVEDKQHNLWIGTYGGLKRLNKKTKKLEDIISSSFLEGLNTKAIFSLFLDKDNHIWVGTKNGLQIFDPVNKRLFALPSVLSNDKEVSQAKVLVAKQDSRGTIWFGTETSGVFSYQKNGNLLVKYVSAEGNANSLASNWVKDILIYDDHTYWFATRNGVSILDIRTNKFSNYRHNALDLNSLSDDAVWSFLKDKASCVWVGTFAGGINFYYQGNSNFHNIGENIGSQLSLNHLLVNSVVEDKDGSIWVGTFGGGLNHLNRSKKTSEYFSLVSSTDRRLRDDVKTIADDGNGNLWIGSLDGLSLFNKQTHNFKYFNFPVKDGKLSENLINTILIDGPGVWIGSNGGGLRYVLPDGTAKFYYRKKPDLKIKNYVTIDTALINEFSSLPSHTPNGYFDYLNSIDPNFLSDNFVTALVKDEKGNLWVGTQNGLNYYNVANHQFTATYRRDRNIKNCLNNSNITTLFIDSKKRLWVGTEGGGLNYFEPNSKRFFSISKSLGLDDDVIHSIVEDDLNNIWISTDYGIFRIKFKNFRVPFKSEDLKITAYSANDGLISNQFSTNAGIKLTTNEIIFGGINGLSIFYPDQIIKNAIQPKVAITQILINNKEVLIDSILEKEEKYKRLTINYDQSNLSFKFSALNYINAENNQYAYKLEGLTNSNNDWQYIGKQRVVNFANLNPGKYLIHIKAANNDAVWSSYINTLEVIILPPWWRTWWAYSIYIVIFGWILYVIIRFLQNRERLRRDLYLEHLQNERQQELYQMKLNFFTNISHEIRTPLTLILAPLEKLLSSTSQGSLAKQLELMKNNADRLMRLVTELLDFRKVEDGHMKIHCSCQDIIPFCKEIFESFRDLAEEKNINYHFNASLQPILIYFDSNQLEKVVFNLLSNAFKFTNQGGEITLSIALREDDANWVDITVTDNGKGIPENMQDKIFESFFQVDDRGRQNIGSGIGLALSKSIIELHKGKISVSSNNTENGLTKFKMSLRTGNQHLSQSEINTDILFEETTKKLDDIIYDDEILNSSAQNNNKKYQLLVVEDNDEVRKLIVNLLIEDYHVVDFANGLEALNYINSEIPDIIISDIMMPGMDGLELCKHIKTTETTNHIPVVLLTARASVAYQLDGLSIGADAYISKPFSPQLLSLQIKNLLKAQEVMRDKFSKQITLEPTNTIITSPEEKFLYKLMEIIESKMEDPEFGVTDLVDEIGMSKTVLYKKVKALTNYSIADLIKSIRLKKAAQLLAQNKLTISEIAYTVGFNDRKYFSKEFRKQFGKAPSAYLVNDDNLNPSELEE
ncbi:response regulator, partial [Pelobium sp.]